MHQKDIKDLKERSLRIPVRLTHNDYIIHLYIFLYNLNE